MNDVIEDLRAGLGVEDIAVKRGLNVKSVRGFVRHLRHTGGLKSIIKIQREDHARSLAARFGTPV